MIFNSESTSKKVSRFAFYVIVMMDYNVSMI